MDERFKYILGFYTGRIDAVLAVLIKSEDKLLEIGLLGRPLYELLLIGALSGMEAYLHDRLKREIETEKEKKDKYIRWYNQKYSKRTIADDNIMDSLAFHTYHNLNIVNAIFNATSKIDYTQFELSELKSYIKKDI